MKTVSYYESTDKKKTSFVSFDSIKNVFYVEKYLMAEKENESFYDVEVYRDEETAENIAED